MAKKEKIENTDNLLELNEKDAEKIVCKQLLNPLSLDNSLFVHEFFKAEWFKNDTLKTIYKFLRAYFSKYQSIPKKGDVESVFKNEIYASQYANIKPMLASLYEFDESQYSEKFVKDNILKFTKARAIYFAILDNISAIEDKGEIGGCLSQFEKIVRMEMSTDLGTDYFKNIDTHIEKLCEENSRIPIGIKEFDRMTYGRTSKR